MKNKLYLLLIAILSCFVFAACGETEDTTADMETYEYDNSGDVKISNGTLSLTVSGSSTQIEVKDERSGKVYRSNPTAEEIQKYCKSDGQFKDVLSSTLGLTYSNSTDTQKEIDNYSQCIRDNKFYDIDKVSDNEIAVKYSIGDFEKTYVCPVAIKESRMKKFLEKIPKMAQKSVLRCYIYYNYDELSSSDDSSDQELLTKGEKLFPDLKDEPIYYLDEKVTDARLKQLETRFKAVGYTAEDRAKDMGSYKVSRNEGKPIFDITVHYILEDDQLIVKVPMKNIKYNKDYPIVKLQILPYMGAGNTDEDGYMLVPEGGGGIINFNNGKTLQQRYQSDVYGWDDGQSRKTIIDESKANFAAYAIANKTQKQSFICVSDEGSSYASVLADIAGKNNGYNYSTFVYNMIHGENMDVSSKSDTTVRVYEEGLPDETLTQRYIFSDSTDYSDLAVRYREYLQKKYPNLQNKKEETSVPLAVEMIGAVDDTEHILGYPVVRSQSLTSYSQAEDILKKLKESGINNINAKYTGWFNTGVKQTSAIKVKTVGRLGSKSDLKDLTAYANATDGTNLYLNGTFTYAYKDKWFDGFSSRKNAAKFVSREECELFTLDPVTYKADDENRSDHNYDNYYLLKPSYSMDAVDNYVEKVNDLGTKNIGFEDIGNSLAGDYNPKKRVSREASLNLQVKKMQALKQGGNKLMITAGNQYAVPYADYVTDMNIAPKTVNIVDEQVPFYQMALHGLVNYSGSPINLSDNEEENVLKSAETGAGLYFTYIAEDTSVLQNGKYTKYYACNFDQWKDDTVKLYTKFNESLGDTYNQYIVGHEKLADGVYKTTYENGKSVIVNYNYEKYDYQGTTVESRDFAVVKGGEE